MSKIHSNQSIDCLLMAEKKKEIEILKNPKAFNDYSQTIDEAYKNLDYYNPTMKRSVNSV